jgi:TonB family protein
MTKKFPMQAVRIRVQAESYDELAILAQRAQALTSASGTAIALHEGNAGEIICRARAGSSAPEVGTALLFEGTFTGLCIQSGKELRCDDAETDTRMDKEATRALGIRSMVAIPIKEDGRVVGVLAAFASDPHAFSITHVVVLKTMADQIAAYLHRTLGDEAYSREPLPAPPARAAAVAAAASLAPPIKPAERTLTRRRSPVVSKVAPVRATTPAEELDSAPLRQGEEKNRNNAQKKSKSDFRRVFGTLFRRAPGTQDAAGAPKNRPGASVLMLAAAAVAVIAVAAGLSFKLHRTPAALQPAAEAASLPVTPAATAPAPGPAAAPGPAPARSPAAAYVQPPPDTTVTIPAPLAMHDEAQPYREKARPKHEETVELTAGPSRIPVAKDNSAPAPTFDVAAISLGSGPTSGSLSNLVSPVSQPPNPRLLTSSEFEPVQAIKKVQPIYPLVAKQTRLSGIVVVEVAVNKNGKISDLRMISGHALFRDAAFAAVRQWVFKPAKLNGQTIDQSTTIRLHFGFQ